MPGILLVLAHPDDESFVGGGALAYYARRGVPTALLTLTDGQAGRMGVTGEPPLATRETLGAVRREELRRAAAILGIGELITPGWLDGGLTDRSEQEGIDLIARQIRRLRPAVLITFGLEGAPNQHADHIATARWSQAAFSQAADLAWSTELPPHAVSKYYWITWPPTVNVLRGVSGSPVTTVIDLGPELTRLKHAAFLEHATQHDHLDLVVQLEALLDNKEYYHLSQSRVGPPTGEETDLFARIA